MSNKHWITPDWPAPANVYAATTLRTGGVSVGAFNCLNIALHVGDDAGFVRQNRLIIKEMLNLPEEPKWLEQIHSNQVIDAACGDLIKQADASYTNKSGIVCAVMTADCLPLLVCASDGSQVAAIHAGWKGLVNGIIESTLNKMHSPPSDLLAWIGPSICQKCYEVGNEVYQKFTQQYPVSKKAFRPKNTQWLASLPQIAELILQSNGVNSVYQSELCTFELENELYSYRRTPQTGRIGTLIWFNDQLRD